MTAKTYAEALYALFQKEPESHLGARFAAMLRTKGKDALLPLVAKEIERLFRRQKRMETADVIVVSSHHSTHAVTEAKELIGKKGGNPDSWTIRVIEDPNLVGGHIIRMSDTLLDQSDRSALYGLYQRLKNS